MQFSKEYGHLYRVDITIAKKFRYPMKFRCMADIRKFC